jgi:AGZA family xanthine/uracil permease-like MFS transporter
MLDRLFRLTENRTTIRTEVVAGITTFLTMAYIIFVQPSVMADAGMDFGAVMTATCLAAALATLIMGLVARYPIALAPGMGQNFFFTFTVVPAISVIIAREQWQTEPWAVGMGVIFIAGVVFLLLSVFGVREAVMNAISPSMKNAIAVGIGLFIAFIGLKNANVIVTAAQVFPGPTPDAPVLVPGTFVKLNAALQSPDLIVFFFGVTVIAVLHAMGVRGSILWGILATTLFAIATRFVCIATALNDLPIVADSMLVKQFDPTKAEGVVAMPPSLAPTAFGMDLVHALAPAMIPYIILFLFMDVFDTIGTLIGVGEQGGFIKNNKLPRAGRAMLADAVGTVAGAALGTSTVTSYIESAAGVEQGGRTGLTAVVVAIGFLAALFFSPIIAMVGSYSVITAPALVIVGAMMIKAVTRIEWDDYSESIPAFLIVIGIPLSFNIGDGLAVGFIAYAAVKLLCGRGKEVSWIMYALAVVLVGYFVFLRAGIGG